MILKLLAGRTLEGVVVNEDVFIVDKLFDPCNLSLRRLRFMEKRDLDYLARSLRISARLLNAAVARQLERTLRAELNLRTLCKHLDELALLLSSNDLQKAAKLHLDFSVIPHATWLGRRKRKICDQARYRNAGRKGGLSKSPQKRRASAENGAKGGRPRRQHAMLRDVQTLVQWARDPSSDPLFPASFTTQALSSLGSLPKKMQNEFWRRLAKEGITQVTLAARGIFI